MEAAVFIFLAIVLIVIFGYDERFGIFGLIVVVVMFIMYSYQQSVLPSSTSPAPKTKSIIKNT